MNILLLLVLALSAHADCTEKSLVHFFSQGIEVSSELIGADDPCDHFGGNRVYTPKANLYFYVNFNISGNVDLDAIDEAYLTGRDPMRVQIAIVDSGFIKRVYGDPREAVLNYGGDTLFISEIVLAEGRLTELLRDFYGSN